MLHHKTIKKLPEKIQSILISKKQFPRLKDAIKHLEKLGHNIPNLKEIVHETPNFYRFRQVEPQKNANYKMVALDKNNKAVVMTGNNTEVYKTDSRGNTWKPNIVDMGTYKIDTNMPNYYVPNQVMIDSQKKSSITQPRSSIVDTSQLPPIIGGNPNTWTPQSINY